MGLTGGLASGKSTVLEVFRAQGAEVADADRFAREALSPGSPAERAVIEAFGRSILDPEGRIDRGRLASRVFQDPEARGLLEAIVHPEVIRREELWIDALEASGPSGILVVDAALLLEAGRADRYDVVIVVACHPEEQVRRAVARGMSEEDARARIAAQMPVGEKVERADLVIDSSASIEDTRAQARAVYRQLERRRSELEA